MTVHWGTRLLRAMAAMLCRVICPGLCIFFLVLSFSNETNASAVQSVLFYSITGAVDSALLSASGTAYPGTSFQQDSASDGAAGTVSSEPAHSSSQPSFIQKVLSLPFLRTYLAVPHTYAHIIHEDVQVYEKNKPIPPILGIARQNAFYRLESSGESWCMIRYKGKLGWIQRKQAEIIEAPFTAVFIAQHKHSLIFILIGVPLIVLIIFIAFRIKRSMQLGKPPADSSIKRVFILMKEAIFVHRYLTNDKKRLDTFFSEFGFEVKTASDIPELVNLVNHQIPDVVAVDWQIKAQVQQSVEQILASKSTTSNILVLFFNVQNLAAIKRSVIIPNAQYVSTQFSDRDLFNIITPFIITGEKKRFIRKSVEISALQGDVELSNLSDVFQFIEIGKKTGCLLILEEKPIGIVYFNEGMINYAVSQNAIGEKAVIEILNLKKGKFNFISGKKPKETNCSVATLNILMEWTKDIDETSGNRLR